MASVQQWNHACFTHTRTIPAFIPQLQGITALWLVIGWYSPVTEADLNLKAFGPQCY